MPSLGSLHGERLRLSIALDVCCTIALVVLATCPVVASLKQYHLFLWEYKPFHMQAL